MIHILGEFWRGMRQWERPARLALALGLLALFPLLGLWLAGPPEWRRPALAGLCGLGLCFQMVFLWAWRGMLSDWSRAQRLYLEGEFEAACELLQANRAAGRADMRSLTLLGNALRMRGLLKESEAILREAHAQRPEHAFPLVGLGRSVLAQGRFDEAVTIFQAALKQGTPAVVALDHGEALFHAGDVAAAIGQLQSGMAVSDDPGRKLVAALLLQRAGVAVRPEGRLLREGRPWLEAQAQRFAATEYGNVMRALLRSLDDAPEFTG